MREKSNNLLALSAAALLLNGVSPLASANPPDGKTKVDYRYTAYEEADIPYWNVSGGSEGDSFARYDIEVHHLKVKTPITADTEVSAYLISETMTGASPWYVRPDDLSDLNSRPVQVMSSATGGLIDESRTEVGADFRSYNDQSESTFSLSYSTENDYESIGFGYSGAWRFHENLTSLSYGVNGAKDYVDATDADIYDYRPSDESKTRMGGFVGLSRVVTKNTLVSVTAGVSLLEGYLSDPYKLAWLINDAVADSRPDTQNQFSLGFALREFFPRLNGAFHANYGFYSNDWETESHTIDVAWHQNLPHGFQIIPSFRFYSQTAAVFYSPYYTAERNDGYYSSDYRLSEYTSSAGRIRLQRSWDKYTANLSYESYVADGDHPAMLEYSYIGLGLSMEL